MSLQDQLKARLGSEPANPNPNPDATDPNAADPTAANASLDEQEDANNAPTVAQNIITAASEAANYSPKKGDYKVNRLSSVILANGTRVLPNIYGYYEKVEGNKELKELLEYYANQGLVSVVE